MSQSVQLLRAITKKIQQVSGLLALAVFSFQISGGAIIAQSVIISEFMANPVVISDANGEWVELHNVTDSDQDITGWVVDTNSGTDMHPLGAANLTTGSSLMVPAQGYFLICKTAAAASGCDYIWSSLGLSNNVGDSIVLEDTVNGTNDTVDYDGSTDVDAGESTIVNRDINEEPVFTQDETNEYIGTDTGTPGEANPDNTSPSIDITSPSAQLISGSFDVSANAFDGQSGLDEARLRIRDLNQTG